MNRLTDKQTALLRFIDRVYRRDGTAPTTREIANAMGWQSTSTVAYHRNALLAGGFVEYGLTTGIYRRGLRLTDKGLRTIRTGKVREVEAELIYVAPDVPHAAGERVTIGLPLAEPARVFAVRPFKRGV